MRYALVIMFMAIPLAEIALIIKFGQLFGLWPTIAVVIGTAFLGATILNNQGLKAFMRIQESALKGETPIGSVIDAAFIALAGVLLVMPGLITDILGLLLLVPMIRRRVAVTMVRWAMRNASIRVETFERAPRSDPGRQHAQEEGPIIDVKAERLDERPVGQPRTTKPGDKPPG
jgi:UPF0716 protein FxsA